ncbi:kinesin-domain-containing protein [Polyporus arcularius HHB13444]|uniref:Kinesin-like protein n=1 Tax=Polyporus arcularius HHB13444 TaxID=1314778 RepID=A0A5C3PWC0_9APHY|nr:kinesin-domain-containing protein [Polyporus arcularius HHB13444]
MSANSKLVRPIPFTPRRNPGLSVATGADDDHTRLPRSTTPSLLGSSKKYKAPLSSESRTRHTVKSGFGSVPPTPSRSKSRDGSRPKTPLSPRKGSESPFLMANVSEMDVSNVDPEEVLVDFENVEADVSAEIDEAMLRSEYGKEDKVLVSIRIRPSDNPSAWDVTTATQPKTLRLQQQHMKSAATPSQDFRFDEILTGSENKPVYNAVARSHVCAAMDGYNAVIFAYGQTASGKTFTLSGDEDQPGIIPRAMKDVFAYIKRSPTREYLLRCSYIEIYNEAIHDLLAPPNSSVSQPVQIQGTGANVILTPLREEVVTSLNGVHEVLQRGEGNRRTASTDWNERSSRSHSVFRLVIESRERGSTADDVPSGRTTPGFRPPTPGGPKLQARGGKSVQTSVLSLIDLAGSEKATSDKDRTREGKYINTSLLTLGSVISTLGENAAKGKTDHVPFRNSKLTRMLQPSLSGNARISVICTINPDASAVAESTSTLLFAQRIKKVQLHAQKKEVVDTDALLERYRKEIEELKKRLSEKEKENNGAPAKGRRLSAREQLDESLAMDNLNARIRQLTKLILTSQTVDENKGDESRPASPAKVNFDMSPYQLQQELLAARRQIETQANQILSLEAALLARPQLPPDAPDSDKDKLLTEQAKTIRELEIVVKGYEDNLGEPLRAVREDVEKEWSVKLEQEVKLREEKKVWEDELVKQLDKERKMRMKLEDERQALAAFVKKFDSLGLGGPVFPVSKLQPPMPTPGGAAALFAQRQKSRISALQAEYSMPPLAESESPMRLGTELTAPSLLEEEWDGVEDVSIELEKIGSLPVATKSGLMARKGSRSPVREVLSAKENVPV